MGVVVVNRLVFLVFALLLGSISSPFAEAGSSMIDEAASIQLVIDAFAAHFRAQDPEALATLFSDPVVFIDPHRGEAEFSAVALREMFRSDFANIQEVRRYDLVDSTVAVEGESAGVEVTYAVDMRIFETDDAFQLTYGWTLDRSEGAWRITKLWVIDMRR